MARSSKRVSAGDRIGLADEVGRLLRLVRGEWLPSEIPSEARRFLPSLLLGIYEADLHGRKLSKREASALMGVDAAATGSKYIKVAADAGLLTVDRKPTEDKRKDFLRATPYLLKVLDEELARELAKLKMAREEEELRRHKILADLNKLAEILAKQGNYQQSLYYFRRALAMDPKNSTARANVKKAEKLLKRWAAKVLEC